MKDLDYSKCDFPVPYSNRENLKHWFNFNDSSVEPLMPGSLQKIFGGSATNAYVLIYRTRKSMEDAASQPPISSSTCSST